MILYSETFADSSSFEAGWEAGPGMTVSNGVLHYEPHWSAGFCPSMTTRNDFQDFMLTVDFRIVRSAAGVIVRGVDRERYYMIQYDLANTPSVVWFHTFTPEADDGYRVELVRANTVPVDDAWYRLAIIVQGFTFHVLLGTPGESLRPAATWRDTRETYRAGAVGVWEHGSEAAEFRSLRVESLSLQG